MDQKRELDQNFIRIFVVTAISVIIVTFILLGLKWQAILSRRQADEKMLRQVVSDIAVSDKVDTNEVSILVSVNPDITDSSKKARCLQIEAGVKHALTEAGLGVSNSTGVDSKKQPEGANPIAITLYIDEDPEINSENVYAIYNENYFSEMVSNAVLADVMERYTAGQAGLNPMGIGAAGKNAPALSSCETPAVLMLVSYPGNEDIKLSVNRLAKGMAQGLIVAVNGIYDD